MDEVFEQPEGDDAEGEVGECRKRTLEEYEADEELAVIAGSRDGGIPCFAIGDALRVEDDDYHGVDEEYADGNGVAYVSKPFIPGPFEDAHVCQGDTDFGKCQGMDAEDLRQERVVLLLDTLLWSEVVEMSSEAPVCRDKVDDSRNKCLYLDAVNGLSLTRGDIHATANPIA